MKILVIGGMHGNEPLGPAIVALLKQKPIKNVDIVLANLPALYQNCRYIGNDLNRSFPGDKKSPVYEDRRAAELLELCQKFDLVFDFHNTYCSGNDCSFVGQNALSLLYDVSSQLGLKRVIIADYDCINKFAPNCISIEISLDSPNMNPVRWVQRIAELSKQASLPACMDMEKFKFVYRMSLKDAKQFNLKSQNLRAFCPVPASLAKTMGVASPAYPIFIADKYTPYNYGGLLNKIDV